MIRLAVAVRRADAEVALAQLLSLAPGGVEEVDAGPEAVEYALYGAADELPSSGRVRAVVGDALMSVSSSEIADDWSERWREFHRELRLGGRLVVRPPWIAASDPEIDLVIDPGQAFGTGAHATTALCLELLLEIPLPDGGDRTCVDLGCGSGVLGILAARLGWGPVTALDFDPLAVAATRENAAINAVSLAAVERFDLCEADVPPARLVLANLLAPLLQTWCERGVSADLVVASGLLAGEADEISLRFRERGYRERERRIQGDWAALMLSSGVL